MGITRNLHMIIVRMKSIVDGALMVAIDKQNGNKLHFSNFVQFPCLSLFLLAR